MATEKLIKCSQHPEEDAGLMCGKCGKRICTRCMILTGEGVRCTECMAQLNARYYGTNSAIGANWTMEPEQVVIPAEPQPQKTSLQTDRNQSHLIEINPLTGEPSTTITYCLRHPKIETGLRCGRCDNPICPRCMAYTSIGLRCPTCSQNFNPPTSVNPHSTSVRKAGPSERGFRSYGQRPNLHYAIQPQHYALAVLAALSTALVVGGLWGFLFDANRAAFRGTTGAIINSIHLIPEILLGILVGEAVARATGDRRSRLLQLIAVGGVILGYLTAIATLLVRALAERGKGFPDLGELVSATWTVFTGLFSSGGSGAGLSLLLFYVLGGIFAWMRLRR
ncbi:MAG: B-box zinc finger protein [Chloroflexota bacterium]|nr:hypothetical protein [Chloroflexota bacterium]